MNDDLRMQVLALSAMVFAVGAAVVFGGMQESSAPVAAGSHWLADVETGADHIAPEELAAEILSRREGLVLVDVRPPEEFAAFHLPGAVNMTVPEVTGAAGEAVFAASPRLVVLYSNGPAHPAQAWVELRRQGRTNVRVLDGGLDAFKARLLTPPSLAGWLDERTAAALRPGYALRAAFFLGGGSAGVADGSATDPDRLDAPTGAIR